MAKIYPFKALRPIPGCVADIAALPYDVFTADEAKKEISQNPKSFLRIDLPEILYGNDEAKALECAKKELDAMIASGAFMKEDTECLYIYQLVMGTHSQQGIVCTASANDYITGVIKKHENTRTEKEIGRVNHIRALQAQTGPIFLAYRANQTIDSIIEAVTCGDPIYDFTADDGVSHTIWRIEDKAVITKIVSLFAAIEHVYIADGHHRCSAAAKVSPDKEILSVLFADNQLQILPYNRVVYDLNGLTPDEFLEKVAGCATLKRLDSHIAPPAVKGIFHMFLDNQWYEFKKPVGEFTSPVEGLDVSFLQDFILAPILGIYDPKTSANIEFVGGIKGTKVLEEGAMRTNGAAFLLYPTSLRQLFDVSDSNALMPPKSTWFEPKLRSGLFINQL